MTFQSYDGVVIDGQGWILGDEPLRFWLSAHPEVGEAFADCFHYSTANRRGYTADWLIQNDKLYLRALTSVAVQRRKTLEKRLPLFAGWVYGKIALLQRNHVPTYGLQPRLPVACDYFSYISIDGGKVCFDPKGHVPVTVGRGNSEILIKTVPNPTEDAAERGVTTSTFLFPRRGALCPWPGSHIAPDQRTQRWGSVWQQTLDDGADQWGLYAALMAAGLTTSSWG